MTDETKYLLTGAFTCSCGSPALKHDTRFIYCSNCDAKLSKEEFFSRPRGD